jgi:membrane fusion protein (multidrug efflux system)
MNIFSRPQRLFWVLGVVLLVGTAAGAGWFFNHGDAPAPSSNTPADSITCVGYADVPGGIVLLHPAQPGRVTKIHARENEPVKEGDLLLSVDSRAAKLKLQEAEASLEEGRQQLRKAQNAVKDRKFKEDQQQEVINIEEALLGAAKKELEIKEKLFNGTPRFGSEEEVGVYRNKVTAQERKVALEKLKLGELRALDLGIEVNRANEDIKAREARVKQAQLAVAEHDVVAPADGTVLRILTSKGEVLSAQPKIPALQFCPDGKRIIRAEVQQEWASRVAVGQTAFVEDDTRAGERWQGKVTRVSDWFSHRRSMLQEPFQFNDVRTLECLVELAEGSRPLRIHQRVRVTIKQGGP